MYSTAVAQRIMAKCITPLIFPPMAGRKLKVLKEQIIKSGQYGLFHSYVEENFDPEKFKHFKGKDNIFIAVPSTTGKNRFPKAFAEKLQKTFGGKALLKTISNLLMKNNQKTLMVFKK